MKRILLFLFLLPLLFLVSCRKESVTERWETRKVAVILPFDNGQEQQWRNVMSLAYYNLSMAFSEQPTGIQLQYEFYDESTIDIAATASLLVQRNDISAIVGGMYSADAAIIARVSAEAEKPFFTIATSEELVRAYADHGMLWAMVETDISQCEVLLTKALYYGATSVCLIAQDGNPYGKTFINWFGFQASELGMEVKGLYTYHGSADLSSTVRQAASSGADYAICCPGEIEDNLTILQTFRQYSETTSSDVPHLLFSDMAYGADVLAVVGNDGEGLEGVTYSSSPESGFDVAYKYRYHEQPTLGVAQIYDALCLVAYGEFYRLLHPALDLTDALRAVVNGRDMNANGWMGKDMQGVVNALADGRHPDLKGASGSLDFDTAVYTSVLHTTYMNYKIYNGKYITLDYNSSDNSNRSDPALAGWNWKAGQMQNFAVTEDFVYPELHDKWALLVAASTGWENYRHQADVLKIYQILKERGYDDDHIVLIEEDDIAHNANNPNPGVIQVRIGGENVYQNVTIDYHLSNISPTDIQKILCGDHDGGRLPHVIGADSNDNVLFFWSGHGTPRRMIMGDNGADFTDSIARRAFLAARGGKHYRKLMCLWETCFSGSVGRACTGIPGVLIFTAANPYEASKADIYNTTLHVWMSNRFTATLQDQIHRNPSIPLRDLYYRLFNNTVGSHVMLYNNDYYGNIYSQTMEEFL